MKIRRVTLIVLVFLTVLFIFDVRYFGNRSIQEPSIHFNVGPGILEPAAQKMQEFIRSQSDFTSLALKGRHGVVELRSAESDVIKVQAIIWADEEEVLEGLEVRESISGRELSYELSQGPAGQEAGLGFIVHVPDGMEVSVDHQFGSVNVDDFVGFLNLNTSFSNLNVNGIEGTVTIASNFGNINLQRIRGPLRLDNSFATCRVGLLAIDGGYDFDVVVTNGTLLGKAPFQIGAESNNKLVARGQSGEGVHPVIIRSNFGTVSVSLED